MCGRIAQGFKAGDLAAVSSPTARHPSHEPRWNVGPGKSVIAVVGEPRKQRALIAPLWGFIAPWERNPEWTQVKPINARAETMAASKLFCKGYQKYRCMIPVNAWYEWSVQPDGPKQPHAIGAAGGEMIMLGGIMSMRRDGFNRTSSYLAIVTTEAPAALASIHGRAPLVIGEADWPLWLGEIDGDVDSLLKPVPDDAVRSWPVAHTVNHTANEGAALLEPVA
jgi:putative SOS response-associated peptidase YedK